MKSKQLLIIGTIILAACVAFILMQGQTDSTVIEKVPRQKLEGCISDDDCAAPERCQETTTCPPCSETSPEFPENCICHTQKNCVK